MSAVMELPSNYYPTPKSLVDKMLQNIEIKRLWTVLEPSAGDGAIIRGVAEKYNANCRYGDAEHLDIDCIELDVHMQQLLKYNFSQERKRVILQRISEIENRPYDHALGRKAELSEKQKYELEQLRSEELTFPKNGIHIVHNDFLTFSTYKRYDTIVMNPPFDNGDLHLIKAIELQNNGGEIICLLNAETIRNPFTNTRKHLLSLLNKHGAKIQYLYGEFATREAERKTDVEVALIEMSIPKKERKSFIFDRMQKAQEQEAPRRDATELSVGGFIENIINQFNFEVRCTLELIREYEAMKPYMLREFSENGDCKAAILTLSIGFKDRNYDQYVDVNEYMREVRMKYWSELFKNPKFVGKLTSNLHAEYREMVEKLKDYDFTLFNIQQIKDEMNAKLNKGVEDTILALFEKLSDEHSWYPECKNNVHYFSGWATNKAHKINKKVIVPIHGAFSSYSWSQETFDTSAVYRHMTDIEKVFNYLDRGETGEVDLMATLRISEAMGKTKKIQLKYFNITLYKKGTCHIEFTNQRLLDKFNIFGCCRKNWLPPSYGKKAYSHMSDEEKTTIDEFQGKDAYEKVLSESAYYLVGKSELLALGTGI